MLAKVLSVTVLLVCNNSIANAKNSLRSEAARRRAYFSSEQESYMQVTGFIDEDALSECREHMLASDLDQNHQLSSSEYASFIALRSNGMIDLQYRDLGASLVMLFLAVACLTCVSETGDDQCCIGSTFIPLEGEVDRLFMLSILDFICPNVDDAIADILPPSAAPSSSPVSLTSDSPSQDPTAAPSARPSPFPSVSPSAAPSHAPTEAPSSLPTVVKSAAPSAMPSALPTISSSSAPSSVRSSAPSLAKSESPTTLPSLIPTTGVPSPVPTNLPSAAASNSPSTAPSVMPSTIPTASPTQVFSVSPTVVGSVAPSRSQVPTRIPSKSPSLIPTERPTTGPSSSPSYEPSIKASSMPSNSPSSSPTLEPTPSPSFAPSSKPTTTLTNAPTFSPSAAPSPAPTSSPTASPSSGPSATPSIAPSASPFASPSASPTLLPSGSPSETPTELLCLSFSYTLENTTDFSAADILSGEDNIIMEGLLLATRDVTISILNATQPRFRGVNINSAGRALKLAMGHALGEDEASGWLDWDVHPLSFPPVPVDDSPYRRLLKSNQQQRRLVFYVDDYYPTIDNIVDSIFCAAGVNECVVISTTVCVVLEAGDVPEDIRAILISGFREAIDSGEFNDAIPPGFLP